MMGILDLVQSEDPAIQNGLLNFGLSLLQSKGNFGNALGRAGQVGQLGARDFRQQEELLKRTKLNDQLLQMQLEQQQRQQAQQAQMDALAKQYYRTPEQAAMAANGGPTVAAANAVTNTPPGFDKHGFVGAAYGVNPLLAAQLEQQFAKQAPQIHTIGPDQTAFTVGVDGKAVPLMSGPAKPKDAPTAIQEYQFAQSQGYPGSFNDWVTQKAKAGASNVSLKVSNALGEGAAKQVGPMLEASAAQATGANQQIATSDSLIKAVDSGKVIAGPGASFRMYAAQLAQTAGLGGKDTAEAIANTRSAIQGLAQATVAARGGLKGQGQVSDYEGKLLARAVAGDIDSMTPAEIKQIAQVNKRLSQQVIAQHKAFLSKAQKDPTLAPLATFFDVPDMAQSQPSMPAGMPDASAIDAELARRAKGGR